MLAFFSVEDIATGNCDICDIDEIVKFLGESDDAAG